MKLTLAEPRLLTNSINVISELVNEVRFKVDTNHLEIIAMDPANVAMVVFKLLSSAFSIFEVGDEKEFSIHLDSFKQVLRRAKPSDIIHIELDEQKNRLRVKIVGESTRTFNLALIDMGGKKQKIPELTFPLKIEMSTMIFDEAIEDMSVISESVALIAQKDKFIVSCESKMNDAKVEVSNDAETSIMMEGDEEIKAKYSLEYLKKIIKGSKLAPKVTLAFNKNYPLKVEYLVQDKLSLMMILAPRIDNV